MGIALDLAKEKYGAIDAEVQSKVGALVAERDELGKEIKKLERGSGATNGGAPATSDETLVEAVGHLTKSGDPATVTSSQIAAYLGVDSRSIARRLAKMGNDGELSGNKEEGYAAA